MAKNHLHNRTPCLGLPCMIGAATHAALLPAPSDALGWGSIGKSWEPHALVWQWCLSLASLCVLTSLLPALLAACRYTNHTSSSARAMKLSHKPHT